MASPFLKTFSAGTYKDRPSVTPTLKTLSSGVFKFKPAFTPNLKTFSLGMRIDEARGFTDRMLPAKMVRFRTVEGKHLRKDAVISKPPVKLRGLVGNGTVAEINIVSPSLGDAYVVTDSGNITDGDVDAVAGDIVQYNGNDWIRIVSGSRGFVPSDTRVLISTDTTLIFPYVNKHHDGRIVEFDGTSNEGYDTGESTSGCSTIIDPMSPAIEAGAALYLSANPPMGEWRRGGGAVVGVTAVDQRADSLASKLVAGTGIVLTTLNPGGIETLQVSSPSADLDEKVAASSGNTGQYLQDALEAGSNITLSLSGTAPNQKVRIAAPGASAGGGTAWYQEFTATASQVLFNITAGAYVIGADALVVFINGDLVPKDLYEETSTTSFTLTGWPTLVGGEKVVAFVPRGDGKLLISTADTTYGFLQGKIVAGTGVTLTKQNSGADENLRIDAAGGGSLLAVWPAAQNGYLTSATKLIEASLPASCTALRIACNSQSCGNAAHTNGNHIYLRGANTVHGAWSYTTSWYSGNSAQTYSGGVYVNYYIDIWMYVSSWNPLTIWTVALGTSGAHHVVVEVLG